MNIISWNLNGLLSCVKNKSFSPIDHLLPDILCLQEIRTQQEPIIIDGYNHYWKRRLFVIISLTVIYFGKAAAGLDNAHHEEQHQKGAADGLERAMDISDHRPDSPALEVLRCGGDQSPDLRQLTVPCFQGRVEVVHDPVSACYFYRPLSL